MDAAKNFAKGTLTTGIDDSATSLTLGTGQGGRFPAAPFNAVIWNSTDYPDPADDPGVEVLRVTDITGDVLTITRGQEGTDPGDHDSLGKTFQIIAPLTAKVINDIGPAVSQLAFTSSVFTINSNESAGLEIDLNSGRTKLGDYIPTGEGTVIDINDPATTVTITKQLILPDLPSSNPTVAGALYYDAVTGIVKRSAG